MGVGSNMKARLLSQMVLLSSVLAACGGSDSDAEAGAGPTETQPGHLARLEADGRWAL